MKSKKNSWKDRYYTGVEVQALLNITEPALRNLVNQKKIRKIVPPGRKNGLYLRADVDTFAAAWEAVLMSKEPPKATFEIAKAEDMEAVNDLAARAIGVGAQAMNAQLRQTWLAKNSECCYIVKHNKKVVAFLHIPPIKQDRLMAFMQREIRGWDFTPDDIEAFTPEKPLECLIMGIATEPDTNETLRMHYMLVLIRGVAKELEDLGLRGVIISKVYATTESESGIAMALHMEMKEFGRRVGRRFAFVLDLNTSNSFLAKSYKRGFTEWSKNRTNNQPTTS